MRLQEQFWDSGSNIKSVARCAIQFGLEETMANPMTEKQGDQIIALLDKILDKLSHINGEVQRLDAIHDEIKEINSCIVDIAKDVSNLEAKED